MLLYIGRKREREEGGGEGEGEKEEEGEREREREKVRERGGREEGGRLMPDAVSALGGQEPDNPALSSQAEKTNSPFSHLFVSSIQALRGLDEAHPQWGGSAALFSPLSQC